MALNEPADTGEDDQKRRFREALERKNAKAVSGSTHTDAGAKKSRGAHGPVENRREFRRKSG